MFETYKDCIDPYWITLPLKTVNAVSQFEPEWICWEHGKEWVRDRPAYTVSNESLFPFYTYAMTFEEFVPLFGEWYADGQPTACFVGIRAGESLNRWRTITSGTKTTFDKKCYTTKVSEHLFNIYPIYDWQTMDIWTYHGKNPDKEYNPLYDRMYQAGVPLHNMRICEPYGSEQRKGLWLFQIIEPETWWRVVGRVNGANMGAIYANERGNILGINNVTLPENQTWHTFAMLLLGSMPERTREHYKNKLAVYLHWYELRGYPDGIPNEQEGDCGAKDEIPSWRRICKILLRNDYWCKGLSFAPTKTKAYEKYIELMKRRRGKWNLI
jgi:predicted phosphoadenosine phosphosulfate sulfurtransferase